MLLVTVLRIATRFILRGYRTAQGETRTRCRRHQGVMQPLVAEVTPGLLEVVRCRRPGPLWLLLAAQDRSAGSTAIGTLSRSHVRPQTPWASCQARPDLARAGSSHRGGQATLTLFDHQRTLNVANCCAPVSSISAGQRGNGQAPSRRDTVYGSDACVSRVSPRCPAVVRRVNIGAGVSPGGTP